MIVKNVKVKGGDVFNIARAIQTFVTTSDKTTGKILYALNKTSKSCDKILKELDPKRLKITKKYLQVDKKGDFINEKLTEDQMKQGIMPKPLLKEGKTGEGLDAEMLKLLGTEVTLKIHTMNLSDFGMIEFNVKDNPLISIIMDLMVTEDEDIKKLITA